MDAIDQTPPPCDTGAQNAHPHDAATVALWLALDANRRARDERTERLRAMQLICGVDDRA